MKNHFTVRVCRDADAAHTESLRAYGHTFHREPWVICVSSSFFDLSPGFRDGILAHEIGHLLAGHAAGEEDADRAFEAATGVRIQYRDGPHGRCLQWLPASDRRRLIGVFEFDFKGTRRDVAEPASDDVRFFAKTAGTKHELHSLREAEAVADEDLKADVWAQEGRRRLGWRPMARNPGERALSVICAWCQTQISGPPPVKGEKLSHGICKTCLNKELIASGLEPRKTNPDNSLVPINPTTGLPTLLAERLPAHEWKPPRVSFDLLLSGRAPIVLIPEGVTERPAITRAVAKLLTREGIADVNRWEDLHAACGTSARLFVVDRSGERWEVSRVGFDRGAETGWLELVHLGPRGTRSIGIHEGFGLMLPVVVYRPGRPAPRQMSEAEQLRTEIAALWRDHDRCSIRHGQFEAVRIVEQIKGLEARLNEISPRSNPARSPDAWKTPPPCDVEGTGRPLTKKIAAELVGQPVRVHLNLHNGCYVFTHGGLVTAYARFFHLKDVLPRVGVGGYQRCHELKIRNVHAYLQGTFVDSSEPPAKRGGGWRQITYNCKKNQRPCFYFVDNEECFEGAAEVRAWRVDNGDGTERCEVWVKGDPPSRKNPPECRCEIPGGACACGAVDEECAKVVACGSVPNPGDDDIRRLARDASMGVPGARKELEREKRRRGQPTQRGARKLARIGQEMLKFDGMSVKDGALWVIQQLSDLEIAYAANPARGRHRGYVSLHDFTDPNMLVPEHAGAWTAAPEGPRSEERRRLYEGWFNAVTYAVSTMLENMWDPSMPETRVENGRVVLA